MEPRATKELQDLSPILEDCPRWMTAKSGERLMLEISEKLSGAKIDWDGDAGESWMRIIAEGFVIALLHTSLKILLIDAKVILEVKLPKELRVIRFQKYDEEPEFFMRPDAVRNLGVDTDVWNPPGPQPLGFTAHDLYFISV